MVQRLITPEEKEKAEKRIKELEEKRQLIMNLHAKDMRDIDNDLAKQRKIVKTFKEQNRGSSAIDVD